MQSHTPQCTPSRTPFVTQTDIPMTQDAFADVLDLINRHDVDSVIEALSMHARFEAEDEELDLYCRLLAGRRHLELEQLTERMIHYEEILDNLITQAEVTEGR
jgi:hypothetical protein